MDEFEDEDEDEFEDEEREVEDDELEEVVGKDKGPNAPLPEDRRVPALVGETFAADAIDGVLNKETSTIVTEEKILADFFLRLIIFSE